MTQKNLEETQIDSRTVYQGRLLHVKEDRVRLPDGGESGREYILHPGAVAVVPLLDNGCLVMERQFRYPLGRVFLEIPAGKIDPGEDPLVCGQRELEEETGHRAARWDLLGTLHPCIGYSNEFIPIYLARDLSEFSHQRDHDEFLELLEVPFDEALRMACDGRITDGKTLAGLFWAEKFLAA
jgi:ADP-ribose pyrophosphatase